MMTKYSFGDFEFEAPSTWCVGEIDGVIEIVDAKRKGALHLSLLRRTKTGLLSESDARVLVDSFASNNELVPDGAICSMVRATEARAIGSFRPSQRTTETPSHWLVGSVVWLDKAVQASYCTDSVEAERLRDVAAIIESVRLGV